MTSKRGEERASFDELFAAHRSQARGLLHMIKDGLWTSEPVEHRVHVLGNYMLLTSLLTPDIRADDYTRSRLHKEKVTYVDGMVDVGFRPEAATQNADIAYSTNLRDLIYPLVHIPHGSPELIETYRKGKFKSCDLDEVELCVQALLFGAGLTHED